MLRRITRQFRMAGLVMSLAITSVGLSSLPVRAAEPVSISIADAADDRSQFGFASDYSVVEALLSEPAAQIIWDYGFPITTSEQQDLLRRSSFVDYMDREVLPSVRRSPAYGGVWIDQRNGGVMVIGLVGSDRDLVQNVRALIPDDTPGVRFVDVTSSAADLTNALTRLSQMDAARLGFVAQAAGVRFRTNSIVIQVEKDAYPHAKERADGVSRYLGVSVDIELTSSIRDLEQSACTSRGRCYGPFRLGDRIYWPEANSSASNANYCGMSFHVVDPSDGPNDKTFLTAGHCVYTFPGGTPDKAGPWHHDVDYRDAYGRIGYRSSSRYNDNARRDIALVRIENWSANKTTRIYGDTDWPDVSLTSEGQAVENETLCASLANSGVFCGVADMTIQWWISTTHSPDLKVWGSAMDFPGQCANPYCPAQPGDSGSPIYRKTAANLPPFNLLRVPIGVVNAGFADTPDELEQHSLYFASVWWALNNADGWPGLGVYRGPQGTP